MDTIKDKLEPAHATLTLLMIVCAISKSSGDPVHSQRLTRSIAACTQKAGTYNLDQMLM